MSWLSHTALVFATRKFIIHENGGQPNNQMFRSVEEMRFPYAESDPVLEVLQLWFQHFKPMRFYYGQQTKLFGKKLDWAP